jgi:hypothetical protein
MTPHEAARELAHSMRLQSVQSRDWRAHWLNIFRTTNREGIRRIAQQALANLGTPHREPGEDDI